MKVLLIGVLVSIASTVTQKAFSLEPYEVNDESVAFLYEARADIRAPDHNLAEMISIDYKNAREEFTRHDLMQQIKPVINKRIEEAKSVELVALRVGGQLGEYDFENHMFNTGFGGNTFLPFQNKYAVQFTNANFLSNIPVSIEEARTLSGALRQDRRAAFTIEATISGVKEDKINYSKRKILLVTAIKVSAELRKGGSIGPKQL